jgi:hypothetical protein
METTTTTTVPVMMRLPADMLRKAAKLTKSVKKGARNETIREAIKIGLTVLQVQQADGTVTMTLPTVKDGFPSLKRKAPAKRYARRPVGRRSRR